MNTRAVLPRLIQILGLAGAIAWAFLNRHLARRAELRRDFIAFHDGFPTELRICVSREYLLTIGVRG